MNGICTRPARLDPDVYERAVAKLTRPPGEQPSRVTRGAHRPETFLGAYLREALAWS